MDSRNLEVTIKPLGSVNFIQNLIVRQPEPSAIISHLQKKREKG